MRDINREGFVFDNGYGLTTDIYMLPVGTEFKVVNGHWDGKIIEENGRKKLLVLATGKKIELKEDRYYSLVIKIKESIAEKESEKTESEYVLDKIPLADDALAMSLKYKEIRKEESKLQDEKAVILGIEKSIKRGSSLSSFRLNTSEGKWIRKNEQLLRDRGYKLDYYMGRNAWVEVKWGE